MDRDAEPSMRRVRSEPSCAEEHTIRCQAPRMHRAHSTPSKLNEIIVSATTETTASLNTLRNGNDGMIDEENQKTSVVTMEDMEGGSVKPSHY